MSIISSTAHSTDSGFYDFPINQSLRFDGTSSYLSRTPSSAGNRKTWTWSGWVKRGNIGSNQSIFASNGTIDTTFLDIRFNLSNQIQVGNYTSIILVTTQVFRDPSAWYHIVWLLDTTQATASNKCRLFVNGVEITGFSTDARSSHFAQYTDYGINNSALHEIARNPIDSSKYFNGYMANIQFIDGQALDPYFFGESKNGVWIPYNAFSTAGSGTATASDGDTATDSYGTNGFHLTFEDATSTTTLGYDYSGNNNHWTLN